MPSAEELEEWLDESMRGFLEHEAEEHGWTEEQLSRMMKMEACKERGLEDVD